jgi:hypothetical protein
MRSLSLARASSLATAAGATALALYVLRRRKLSSSTASRVTFETVDVFTAQRFGGNQLAVVFDEAQRLTDQDMRDLAIEFCYSETTFVLPPRDAAHTARVRIFSIAGDEMPFAGHPNVGTATALAWRGTVFGQPIDRTKPITLEEIGATAAALTQHTAAHSRLAAHTQACLTRLASSHPLWHRPLYAAGVVPLDLLTDAAGNATGAMLTAPEPFAITTPALPADVVAEVRPRDRTSRDALARVAPSTPHAHMLTRAHAHTLTCSHTRTASHAGAHSLTRWRAQPRHLTFFCDWVSGARACSRRRDLRRPPAARGHDGAAIHHRSAHVPRRSDSNAHTATNPRPSHARRHWPTAAQRTATFRTAPYHSASARV